MQKSLSTKPHYTLKEMAEQTEVPYRTLADIAKRLFPEKIKHGKTTYFNETEISIISKEMKKAHNVNSASTRTVAVTEIEENETVLNAIQILTRRQTQLEQKVKELTPKADCYNTFIDTGKNVTMQEFAKMIGYGRNKMMAKLRELNILTNYNLPYENHSHRFIVRQTIKDDRSFTVTFVKPEAFEYLKKKLSEEVK